MDGNSDMAAWRQKLAGILAEYDQREREADDQGELRRLHRRVVRIAGRLDDWIEERPKLPGHAELKEIAEALHDFAGELDLSW